jgi:hypothetical protein
MPELRIIDPALEALVEARLADLHERYKGGIARKGLRTPERATGKYLLSGGMLVCPTCKGHFEAFKSPWRKEGVYVCSTRRRKPGICGNTLELPIAENDEMVLAFLEGRVLDKASINDLLRLVDSGDTDDSDRLVAQRDKLHKEIKNLLKLAASGVSAKTTGPDIRKRELEIERIEAQLRAPKPPKPDLRKVREALTQKAVQWKKALREEPKVGRLVLRKLVEPIMLHDESERPKWMPYGNWKRDKTGKTDWIYVPVELASSRRGF